MFSALARLSLLTHICKCRLSVSQMCLATQCRKEKDRKKRHARARCENRVCRKVYCVVCILGTGHRQAAGPIILRREVAQKHTRPPPPAWRTPSLQQGYVGVSLLYRSSVFAVVWTTPATHLHCVWCVQLYSHPYYTPRTDGRPKRPPHLCQNRVYYPLINPLPFPVTYMCMHHDMHMSMSMCHVHAHAHAHDMTCDMCMHMHMRMRMCM